MPHLLYVTTVPLTLDVLMRGHLEYMQQQGYQVTAVSSPGDALDRVASREGVAVEAIAIAREVRPLRDLAALIRLIRLFRRCRPDLVNAGTPKAGLLGMLAARFARVPVRIYTVRGLRGETLAGFRGLLLGLTERLAALSATGVVCVSDSLKQVYEERGYASPRKLRVLGAGSSNGVEIERFRFDAERREGCRRELGIPLDAPVVGFVGRIVRDKGIEELVEAFDLLRLQVPLAVLVVLGGEEPEDPISQRVRGRIAKGEGIVAPGVLADTSGYYSAFDVLAFPSYREGMPNAVLEAGAAGVPCVGFDATGTRDAVVDGETGALVGLGDAGGLASAIAKYLSDPQLRESHGSAAAERVRERFDRAVAWRCLADYYHSATGPIEG